MSDNVKAFPGACDLPENPLKIAQRRPGFCRHDAVIIDEHTRTVLCADPKCGATLDAFDFIKTNAHTIQRAWESYRYAAAQSVEIAERVSVLKKEEQRLRAMVKRLQEKTGAVFNPRSLL